MKKIAFLALMPFLMLASCKSHYEVASVQRSRILVDAFCQVYDGKAP